ncbi:speckle-type POZ protein-like [Leptopilina boulardi]|uniref:speckle-type POZ protein-like n=1 Tax=Leptopilina boulardi TaxID=63433 RepID=UPI0021F57654|nr:speckle-type POZ protein-like [Leptopilina boulardi]
MDQNGQDISKSKDVKINFDWELNSYNKNSNYTSTPFEIEGISNVKWFLEMQQSKVYVNALYAKNEEYIRFRLLNETNIEYYCENPVEIDIKFGYSYPKVFTMTRNIINFTMLIPETKLMSSLGNNSYVNVNLAIKQPKNEQKSIDIVSPSTTLNDFQPFLMSDVLSDVVFKINEKQFPAHKVILASTSPVFEKMFTHQMKENITNNVLIEETDPEVFEEMLNYIYTGKINNLNTMAFGLYELANKYHITKLKKVCEQCLGECLAIDNVISILTIADRCNSTLLKNKCIEYVDMNLEEVKKTESFKDLGKDLLIDLLLAIKIKTLTV